MLSAIAAVVPLLLFSVGLMASTGLGFAITNGHCQKNISVKYQVPVTKSPSGSTDTEQYVVYEERIRWDTVQVCCPGYRTILFGFCEPICLEACPAHSYCMEPNKCRCMRGYEHSYHHQHSHQHQHKNHEFNCRPICHGGCPEHSQCIAHNECECRAGYKDVSSWFSLNLKCERIKCGQDQRYDVHRHACTKIEMSVEELMQRVAERLAKGLEDGSESPIAVEEAQEQPEQSKQR
ncbi:uncharacterized protein NimC3 [Drosophila tropicalis]|uniref:uncharacterized protein NimC3 n=1 Tax=Drosophila tropicalis TaxID=46794 RepID=UPI0035AC12EA